VTAGPDAGAPLRAREAKLTAEQLDLTRELARRADKLWTDAGGDLSLAEAVELAAVQIGYFTRRDGAA
jgi:hypothetical protein